jgi:ankyrin repeat protein
MVRPLLSVATLACLAAIAIAGTDPDALWMAARKGDVETVKALLAKGADVNAKTEYGATALSFAADKGHVEVVKVLLANKADVNVKDTFYNATPLTWAIGKNHAAIVQLIVEAGAQDVDAALLYAVKGGNVELAQTILKKAKLSPATLDMALAATPKKKSELIGVLTKAGATPAKASGKPAVKVDADVLKSYVGVYCNEEFMAEFTVVLQASIKIINADELIWISGRR